MSEFAKLPARVQPQIWNNDQAIDVGESIRFDAHDALIRLEPAVFSRVVREIQSGGHDYDDLVLNSGAVDAWLDGHNDATFHATIDEHDFKEWLDAVGLKVDDALVMNGHSMQSLREACDEVIWEKNAAPAI